MPAFVTHMLLGAPLRDRLSPLAAAALRRWPDAFSWGLIGPDVLFFHPGGGLPALGGALHKGNPFRFFEAMSRAALATPQERPLLEAYLAGVIGHYRLDSTVHPYVYSQQRRDEGKSPDRCRGGAHHRIEADIDTALYRRRMGEPISALDVKRAYPLDRAAAETIGRCLSSALRESLHAEADPRDLAAAFAATRRMEGLLLVAGRSHMLRQAVGLADRLHGGSPALAHLVLPKVDYDALNLRHQPWDDPSQNGAVRQESLPELFEQAAVLAAADIERLLASHAAGRTFLPDYRLPFGNGAPKDK